MKMSTDQRAPTNDRLAWRLVATAALLGALGCQSDDNDDLATDEAGATANTEGRGDAGMRDAGAPADERFVLVQRVVSADDRQQYMHVLDGLPSGRLDPAQGYEIGGYAQFNHYDGYIYVSSGEDQTLRRYAITAEGEIEERDRLSFASFGLATGSPYPEFIGDEAWVWNGPEVIIVDLERFEIATPDPLDFSELYEGLPEGLQDDAYVTGAGFQRPTRVRDGKLYVVVSAVDYADPLATDAYYPKARVGIIDVASRELLDVVDDERCMSDGDTNPIEADGKFYLLGTAAQSFRTVWGDGAHSCLIRFDTSTDAFDPDGYIELPPLLDGREALEINWFADGVFYLPATDTSAYGDDEDRWNAILGNNPARWVKLDVNRGESEAVTGDAVGAMGPWGNAWLLPDRVFLDVTRGADGVQSEETTLVEVDVDTQVATELFSYAGDAVGFFQIED